jgi:dTDP-glucose 4,6-dehydratase
VLDKHPEYRVVNFDKLTYAGNLENLKDVERNPRYGFVKGDITDVGSVEEVMAGIDAVLNFAAESHVDRSILSPDEFVLTNVLGVNTLLKVAREKQVKRFVQISTDEVYGSIPDGSFKEEDCLRPSSPYSASKAGGDLLAFSYWVTHHFPVTITRSSNNFGPYQYPEKVIPLFVTNALEGKPLPLYGDGLNIRDWLYVEDNCEAIDLVLHRGKEGEIYNIGAGSELTNLELTRRILQLLGKPETLTEYVKDRPGHDRRYSVECSKIRGLGWQPRHQFEEALEETIRWYENNTDWWKKLKS